MSDKLIKIAEFNTDLNKVMGTDFAAFSHGGAGERHPSDGWSGHK